MGPSGWPDPPALGDRAVLLAWLRIDPEAPGDDACLSASERARGERFLRESDRVRHRARSVFLRRLLARLTGLDAAALAFVTGEHGKPELAPEQAGDWRFNLSHSGDRILIGVARGRAVGVDVEAHRLKTDVLRMARQVFTKHEAEVVERCDETERMRVFFRGWCRKEAALKATGDGFAREPRTVQIGLDERAPLVPWTPADESYLARYTLADLEAPAGFSACACVEGDGWEPVVFDAGSSRALSASA